MEFEIRDSELDRILGWPLRDGSPRGAPPQRATSGYRSLVAAALFKGTSFEIQETLQCIADDVCT